MIEELTKDFIEKIVIEVKKENNKKKIKEYVLNPILNEFSGHIYPYISMLFIMYSLNLILIIIILFLILLKKSN